MDTRFDSWKKYFPLGLILIFSIFLLFELNQFLNAFLGAIILYVLLRPLMQRRISRGKKKGFSAILIMLLSFLVILLPVLLFSYLFISKLSTLFSESSFFLQTVNSLDERLKNITGVEVLSQENILSLQQTATGFITQFLGESLSILADLAVMYFILYYMLINTGKIEDAFDKYLPLSQKSIDMLSGELKSQTYSNALGAPLLALVQGIFAWIGYMIFGLDDAFFWGMMTGFFSFIPFVGSALIWVPAAIYQFTVGPVWQGAGIVLYGILVIGTVDNVFRFVFQKQFADVHPLITVFGVIIGLQVFGVPGVIFGPLLLSWFILLIRIYREDYLLQKSEDEFKTSVTPPPRF